MSTAINGSNGTPSGLQQKLQLALSGVQTVLPTGSALSLDSATVTQAQLAQQLQTYLATFTAASDEKTVYLQKLKARTAIEPTAREYLAQVRGLLIGFFGRNSPMLAKFGFSASTPKKATGQSTVIAAAKRAVTKQKRGTLTKTQKAGLKAIGTPEVSLGSAGLQVTQSAADLATSAKPAVGSTPVVAATPAAVVPTAVVAAPTVVTPTVAVTPAAVVKSGS